MLKNLFFKNKKFTDLELIEQYKSKGDVDTVGELFERYTRFVFLVCLKYLKNEEKSKDAVMQIFEKLLIDLKKHEIENFKLWLHSVTRNYCLQILRKEKSLKKKSDKWEKEQFSCVENDENLHLYSKEDEANREETLQDAISKLKIEQKECINLFYMQEKSYEEISRITKYSLKEVKSHLQNGKRNLKKMLLSQKIVLFFLLKNDLYSTCLNPIKDEF